MGLFDAIGGLFGTDNKYQASGGFNDLNRSLTQSENTTFDAMNRQKSFLDAMNAQNGLGNQSSVFGQQQSLADILQQQAMGGGPNPALNQLAQTTGQNVANQAALMASQRGASANPGLIARQAAQQGGALQQQSAGQAATMRAQQQLAAQGALQNQQAMMGNMANTQVGQQQQGIGALANMGLQNQAQILGMQQNMNNINAGVAGGNQQANSGMAGSLTGLGMAAMMPVGKAHGGQIPGYAKGGMLGVDTQMPGVMEAPSNINLGLDMAMPGVQQAIPLDRGPNLGVDLSMPTAPQVPTGARSSLAKNFRPTFGGETAFSQGVRGGLQTGEMLGNIFRPSGASMPIIQNGKVTGEQALSQGGKVPGKPKVFGDSEVNDTVPAKLSPGEVVIPRSKVKDPKKVADFINSILGMNLKVGSA